MTKVLALEVALVALGLIAGYAGNRLSIPILRNSGIALFGVAFLMGGIEAIVTRRIAFARGWTQRETYRGLSAVFYGIIFLFVGAGLAIMALILHLGVGQAVLRHFVIRPGLPLATAGILLLMWSGVALAGPVEMRQGPRWIGFLDLLVARLLPGLILVVLGLAVTGAGMLEIVAPTAFDEMGGEYLEILVGAREWGP